MVSEIIIWTHGGPKIGMGHVMRSVNLAHALSKAGKKPSFIINSDENSAKRLLKDGFTFLTNSFDSVFTHASLDIVNDAGVIIIDTKRDVTELVRLLQAKGIKVVLIDNTTNAAKLADLLIIPSIQPVEDRALAEKETTYSGADYLIIGDKFIEGKGHLTLPYAMPLRVLVTYGGADPNDITSIVVDALCKVDDLDVTVVIGEAFTRRDPYAVAAGCKHVRCVSGLTDLAPVMREAHVAFTANGTSIYELAYMGVPSLVIANYKTDLIEFDANGRCGFSTGLGLFSDITPELIQNALMRFADKKYFEACSRKALDLTDGLGAKRSAELIVSLFDGA